MIISPSAISPYKIPTFQSGGGAPPFSFGNALEFDGVNDFVSIPNINITNNFTISFWAKDSTTTGMYFGNTTNDDSFYKNAADKLQVGINNSFFNFTFASPTILNEWSHYVLTKNGNSVSLYVDGIEAINSPRNFVGNSTINRIGRYRLNGLYFNGVMDEIAIWVNTIGTSQNAIDLYNSGNGALASSIIPSPTAYWRMNGTSGDSTAIDEQGTYNGTLINFDFATCWVAH